MRFRQLLAPAWAAVLLTLSCEAPPHPATPGDSQSVRTSAPSAQWPIEAGTVFEDLVRYARYLATEEFGQASSELPRALVQMSYDEYRAVAFRPEAAIWRDESPFEIQLFHPGFLYPDPVRIHLVGDGKIQELAFDPTLFEYREPATNAGRAAARLGSRAGAAYAGFRIHFPLNDAVTRDEAAVFLGASYFRLLGRGHAHGLSSRGIAVNIAEDTGEEFPDFRAFWLVRPDAEAVTLTFFGLLDGPSVSGAYRFDLTPGAPTSLQVDARLFARRDVRRLGIAPLTSMFLFGADKARFFDDYRPQVHDSEGLLMHTSEDEWIWRPLTNREGIQVTSLRDSAPKGFGLVQRERNFESYLDLEAQYHRRPSEWVEIEDGDWGSGGVELLEIPTPSEFNDNIAAYWVPDEPFRAGDERRFSYRLVTFDDRLEAQTLGQVVRTRIGLEALPGGVATGAGSPRRFIVDFHGGPLADLGPRDEVEPVFFNSAGEVRETVVQELPENLGYRASFHLVPEGARPIDMILYLTVGGERVTESWSYLWTAPRDG